VVGAGITGMQAALGLGDHGYRIVRTIDYAYDGHGWRRWSALAVLRLSIWI